MGLDKGLPGALIVSWTFKTEALDGTPGYSSAMTKSSAIAFARDILATGIRVVKMESTDGDALDEDEIKTLCERGHRGRDTEHPN